MPNAVPVNLDAFVLDALKRGGVLARAVEVHHDAIVVQPNACAIPVTVRTRGPPAYMREEDDAAAAAAAASRSATAFQHLVIKTVDLNVVTFRDDAARDRTRRSFANECAFYRDVVEARGNDSSRAPCVTYDPAADGWAIPSTTLVEGDHHGDAFVIVMSDAHGGDRSAAGARRLGEVHEEAADAAACKMGLTFDEAMRIVRWQGAFHARHWRGLSDSPPPSAFENLWARGGYWTLEKRVDDVPRIVSEWNKLVTAFPEDPTLIEHRDVGARLAAAAPAISRAANRRGAQTLVHGDLKAANVIFPIHAVDASDPAAEGDPDPDPVVIDWQWVGPGAVAHDLLYFLATSLSMDALTRVDELVEAYHAELTRRLRARGHHAAADAFTATDLREDLDVHAADYLRYCAGSVFGELTPERMAHNAPKQNYGIARRSMPHLTWLVRKAARALDAMESRAKAAERNETRKTVAEVLGVSLLLADVAGGIIRGVASGSSGEDCFTSFGGKGGEKRVKDKAANGGQTAVKSSNGFATDPQTAADRRSERMICDALRRKFGDAVVVLGEEALEGALDENPGGDGDVVDEAISMEDLDVAAAQVAAWEIQLPTTNSSSSGGGQGGEITVWVDPLDGTREYVEGPEHRGGVTSLIGIAVDGVPVAGVIHQPFVGGDRGRTLWGGVGFGVWSHAPTTKKFGGDGGALAATPVHPPARAPDASAFKLTVATTRSHAGPAIERAIERLKPDAVVRVGGAGGKIALMLDGCVDAWVFPKPGTKRWDTCAGEALLRALQTPGGVGRGGWLVDAKRGNAYAYGGEERGAPGNVDGVVAAADGALFGTVARALGW